MPMLTSPGRPSRILAATLLACGVAVCCRADEKPQIDVAAAVDPNRVKIGDVLQYKVTVTCPQGTTVTIPDAEQKLGSIEVRDSSTTQQDTSTGIEYVFSYELQVFDVGDKSVSGLEVEYVLPGQAEPIKVHIPSVKLTVESVLEPGAGDIKDIRDPVPITMGPNQWILAAALALVLLLVLAALGYALVRLYQRRKRRVAPRVLVAPHVRALQELEALARSSVAASGDLTRFFDKLSETMREYLEARFQVRAMERTTWMIRRDLQSLPVDEQWQEALTGLLRHADMIKFAKAEATGADADEALALARRLLVDAPVEDDGEGGGAATPAQMAAMD